MTVARTPRPCLGLCVLCFDAYALSLFCSGQADADLGGGLKSDDALFGIVHQGDEQAL